MLLYIVQFSVIVPSSVLLVEAVDDKGNVFTLKNVAFLKDHWIQIVLSYVFLEKKV